MGTKVQCKSYSPVYYSMRDLNEDAKMGKWPIYYEDKTLKNGQYYNCFLPRPTIDGYSDYDKEMLKQTMLRHEAIFRKQVYELHRLYRIQRDLMDELKRKEMHNYLIPVEASQSSPLSSQTPSEVPENKWKIPSLPLVSSACRQSITSVDNMQSPLNFLKESSIQSSSFQTQIGGSSNDCELLESKSKNISRKGFDLHLPANEYLDSEEEVQIEEEKGIQASVVTSYPPKRNYGVAPESDVKLSLGSGGNPSCRGDASETNLCSWNKQRLADLNEPVQVEEATTSACVNFLGPASCHGESQQQDPPAKPNSVFEGLPREFFQNTQKGKDNGASINVLHLENERNRWEKLSGQNRTNLNSSPQGFYPGKLPPQSEPVHEFPSFLLPDDSKRETRRGRVIFNKEISERSQSLSNNNCLGPVVVPRIPSSYQTVPHSDVISGSSLISSWIKPMSSLSQSSEAVQEPTCFNISAALSPNLLIQSPGLIGDKMHLNRKSRLHSSFGSEVSYRNGFFHGSQSESSASQVHFPSVGLEYLNCSNDSSSASEHFENHPMKYFRGSNCMDVKSAKDKYLNVALKNGFQNGTIPQCDLVTIDGEAKNKDPSDGLPWLREKQVCKNGSAKGREDLEQKGLDFSLGHSPHFTSKIGMEKVFTSSFIEKFMSDSHARVAEPQRIGEGDCPGNKKIFGVPIFDKPSISKDQYSFSSLSKSLKYPTEVEEIQNSRKVRLIDIDLSRDPALSDYFQQLSSDNLLVDKGQDKDSHSSMYHINLNSCTSEEEAPSTPYGPRVTLNIAAEIDLEAPVVPETESIPTGGDSLGNLLETGQNPSDELVRVAADAIVTMSSTVVHNHLDDATCHPLETSLKDSLHWFAEIVTSNTGDPESEVGVVLREKGSSDHDEFSDGSDYFESMTLKLTEATVDEYCCEPWVQENQKEEERGACSLVTRRRRGQARRGRQRRDFQRDILPGLASLSRHEVTEDLQTFGGLMRATGHPWQTGLARRNAARNGRARGRRHSTTVLVSTVCSPPRQQPINNEQGLGERSLKGWGKTTRRPRRQRFPAGTPTPLTQV